MSHDSTPPIGVVTVNYGSHRLLVDNFSALADAPFPLIVVVVDNFSTTAESRAVAELCAREGWTLVALESNVGFGAGVNAGVAAARSMGCDEFVIVNPDARISQAVIASLAARVRADNGLVVSPRIVKPDGGRWFDGGTVALDQGSTRTAPGSDSSAPRGWLSGACLAIHHSMWAAVGGFDDGYFLYWEDVDLSWRVVAAGGRLAVDSELEVVHSVGGTQQDEGKSPTYVFYNCRNRLIFARSHLSAACARSWVRSSPRYAREVLLRGGRRALVRDAVRMVSAAVRGTVAGFLWRSAAPERG